MDHLYSLHDALVSASTSSMTEIALIRKDMELLKEDEVIEHPDIDHLRDPSRVRKVRSATISTPW